LKLLEAVRADLVNMTAAYMHLLGSAGRAKAVPV
jgi:hypothetical protein